MVQEARGFTGLIRQRSPEYKPETSLADLLAEFTLPLSLQDLFQANLLENTSGTQRKSSRNETHVPAESDFDAIWQSHTSRFVTIGFHTELGMTAEAYVDTLPKFTPQPERFKGVFDTPLLIETRIPLQRQIQLSGLDPSKGYSGKLPDSFPKNRAFVCWIDAEKLKSFKRTKINSDFFRIT